MTHRNVTLTNLFIGLVLSFGALSAQATEILCSATPEGDEKQTAHIFVFEENRIKLVDFEGNILLPYETGVLCGVNVDAAIGSTEIETLAEDGVLHFKVGIMGYIVNPDKDFRLLASRGEFSITKALGTGTFTCSYGEQDRISFNLENCAIK